MANKNEIAAVGVRIVAPGAYFLANKILDQEFLDKLDRVLDQNKVIAKGLTLMEERIRDKTNFLP